jgi:hypothetical protein
MNPAVPWLAALAAAGLVWDIVWRARLGGTLVVAEC